MDRRSFFKSLALIGAAVSVSPHIFIPKFEPVRWKLARPQFTRCEFQYMIQDRPGHYDMRIVDTIEEADRILIEKQFDAAELTGWKIGEQKYVPLDFGWGIKKWYRRIA